jgi:F-type H+-transporting ATPase subunit delta
MKMMNYAKALHQIAIDKESLDTINYQFEAFCDYLKDALVWVQMIDSPMITLLKKYELIEAFDYNPSFIAFLKVLAKNNEMHLHDEIYEQWLYLARAHQKIAHINLYSAQPISDENIQKIKQALEPRFTGKTIELHISIDESLIGGIKTIYQGQSLDRSVAKELEELYTIV